MISPVSCPYIAEWLGDCAGSTGGGSTGSTVSWEEGEGEMEGAAGGVGAEDRKKKKGRSTDLTW